MAPVHCYDHIGKEEEPNRAPSLHAEQARCASVLKFVASSSSTTCCDPPSLRNRGRDRPSVQTARIDESGSSHSHSVWATKSGNFPREVNQLVTAPRRGSLGTNMNSSAAESFVVVETLDLRARSDDEPSESPRPALETPERKAPLEPSSLQKMWDNVYSPPRQRVGDVSIRTLEGFDETAEWEHIFLDLFYVPAISNLSEMLQAIFTHEQ
ncbi:hypothetical protein THAOC_22440, partial [Thalassiosira oceanica]